MLWKKIFAILALATLFTSCATSNSSYHKARSVGLNANEKFQVYGAYKSNIVGTLTWANDDHCNENAFINYVRLQNKAQNVIEIIMNETCTDQNTKCKCSYSGIGVNYTAINAEEATVWNNAISSKNENITTPQKSKSLFSISGGAESEDSQQHR